MSTPKAGITWAIGDLLAAALLVLSHTFYVTRSTYWCGFALLLVFALMCHFKFKHRQVPRTTYLRKIENISVLAVSAMVLLYLLGVATWYS